MSVSLAENALITLEEFLDYEEIAETDTNVNHDRVRTFINGASQQIVGELRGRTLIAPSAQIEEMFDGDGDGEYYVAHRRISDPDDIVLYYWGYDSWIQTTYSLEVVADKGLIYFTLNYVFTKGRRNWRLDYKPGWTQATLPEDLKTICKALVVRQMKLADDKEGTDSKTVVDVTTAYNLAGGIPAVYMKQLEPYRIMSLG